MRVGKVITCGEMSVSVQRTVFEEEQEVRSDAAITVLPGTSTWLSIKTAALETWPSWVKGWSLSEQ